MCKICDERFAKIREEQLANLKLPLLNPNRSNAKKDKKAHSCAMCKPHKKGWESNFKPKEKQKRKIID